MFINVFNRSFLVPWGIWSSWIKLCSILAHILTQLPVWAHLFCITEGGPQTVMKGPPQPEAGPGRKGQDSSCCEALGTTPPPPEHPPLLTPQCVLRTSPFPSQLEGNIQQTGWGQGGLPRLVAYLLAPFLNPKEKAKPLLIHTPPAHLEPRWLSSWSQRAVLWEPRCPATRIKRSVEPVSWANASSAWSGPWDQIKKVSFLFIYFICILFYFET